MGWAPRISLEQGLAQAYEWYLAHKAPAAKTRKKPGNRFSNIFVAAKIISLQSRKGHKVTQRIKTSL